MNIPFFAPTRPAPETGGRKVPTPIVDSARDPLVAERYKALRARFEHRIARLDHPVVAVTSAVAGEGKTVSSLHLAASLASASRKQVLLVDVDLRKADLGRILESPESPGLTEHLAGKATAREIVRKTFMDGLHFVSSGAGISNPADLFSGTGFASFLAEARQGHDIVVLDSPPVVPVSDTLALRGVVDGFLFVCRAGVTPYAMIRQAVDDIGADNILGVVLNGVAPDSGRYYGRYYGKYLQSTRPGSTGGETGGGIRPDKR